MAPWGTIKSKRFFVRFGIGFAAAFVVAGTWLVFEFAWLSAGERSAAQPALVAIDGLQNVDVVKDDDYDAKVQQVQKTVENARQSAATFRDQQVAFALLQYLGSIEIEQETIRTSGLAQNRIEAPEIRGLGPAETTHLTDNAASRSLSLKLHQALN